MVIFTNQRQNSPKNNKITAAISYANDRMPPHFGPSADSALYKCLLMWWKEWVMEVMFTHIQKNNNRNNHWYCVSLCGMNCVLHFSCLVSNCWNVPCLRHNVTFELIHENQNQLYTVQYFQTNTSTWQYTTMLQATKSYVSSRNSCIFPYAVPSDCTIWLWLNFLPKQWYAMLRNICRNSVKLEPKF